MLLIVNSGALFRTQGQGTAPSVFSQGPTNKHAGGGEENIRTSSIINASPIVIRGDTGWVSCPWVNGSGTWTDPYTFSNLAINGGNGTCIYIYNTQQPFLIVNCTLTNAFKGMDLENTTNGRVTDNTCTGNYLGIYVEYGNDNTLANNTCTGNKEDGIYLFYLSSNTLANNFCAGNSGNGIDLWTASNNTLVNNSCAGNSLEGIILVWSSNNNSLAGNNCTRNGEGISLNSGSNNTLSGNSCAGDYDGIALDSESNGTLTSNTCTGNQRSGINLIASNNTSLTSNTCNGNNYGIALSSSSDNIISNNTCLNNANEGIYLDPYSYNNTLIGNINPAKPPDFTIPIIISVYAGIGVVIGVIYYRRMKKAKARANPIIV